MNLHEELVDQRAEAPRLGLSLDLLDHLARDLRRDESAHLVSQRLLPDEAGEIQDALVPPVQ